MTTKLWTGSVSTDWFDPNNWSLFGVPGSGDDVVIGTTANSPTLSASTTVNRVTINASDTLTLAGAATVLTVTNGVTLSSTGGIGGVGAVAAAVTASGAAHITAAGGTLEVAGAITDSGAALVLTIAGATDRLLLDAASAAHTVSFGSSGTLELNTGAALTVGTAMAIGTGRLQLDGATLTDASGVTISTGTITGSGTVAAAVTATGAAHITNAGGLLEVTGTITDSGGALALTITGTGPLGQLRLDAPSAARTVTFASSGILWLNFAATLTLGTAMSIGSGTVVLAGDPHVPNGATLTDASGVTLGGGTITGAGTVNADLSGTGTVEAGSGALLLAGTVASGPTLAVSSNSGIHPASLGIANNAIAAAPVTINGQFATLGIDSSGNLTINGGPQNTGNGQIVIAAGGQLSDSSGFVITNRLIGAGKVTGPISGTGIVEASGGTLELVSPIAASDNTSFEIDNSALAVLLLDSAPGTGNTFTFLGASGELALAHDTGFNGTISGLKVAIGIVAKTNFIDIRDHTVTISAVTGQGTTSGTITLSDGVALNLTNISSTTWFANAVSDGASGTDINLQSSPPSPPPPPPPVPPPNDFYGNGFSDILWQNSDGTAAIWKMDGATPTAAPVVGNPGTAWQVVGSGDFNRDGHADILWQNTNGTVAIWEMNGGTAIAAPVIANPGTSWKVAGTGDFTGDGFSDDILWRNTDGRVAIWEMNGANVIAAPVIADNPGTSWRVAGTGDFYGRGYSDILWQNSDGRVAIWEMNGVTQIATPVVGNPGASWKAVGAGDFNRDGYADILWQNTDGAVAIWEMNGANVIAAPVIGNPGTAWTAIGAEDFTGDGFSDDILWRNTDGTVAIWELNGANVTAAPVVGNPGASWHPILGSSSGTTGGGSSGAASAAGGSGGAGFGFGDISAPVPARSATAASDGITPVSQASGSDALLLPPGATPPLVDPTTPHCALSG